MPVKKKYYSNFPIVLLDTPASAFYSITEAGGYHKPSRAVPLKSSSTFLLKKRPLKKEDGKPKGAIALSIRVEKHKTISYVI